MLIQPSKEKHTCRGDIMEEKNEKTAHRDDKSPVIERFLRYKFLVDACNRDVFEFFSLYGKPFARGDEISEKCAQIKTVFFHGFF